MENLLIVENDPKLGNYQERIKNYKAPISDDNIKTNINNIPIHNNSIE
jgi:hypothetical protein